MRYRTSRLTKSEEGFAVAAALLSLCLFVAAACGQDRSAPEPPQRVAAPKAPADYAPFPPPDSGYVTDLAGLLSMTQEERIEQWLWQVESRRGVEIAVVTIGSIHDYPGAPNRAIEPFATALFNRYGIGNMPENDGVLLLVARRDRKVRIELGDGYAPHRDRDAKRIIDRTILPRFKKDQYAEGITEGVQAIMREFAGMRAGVNWALIGMIVAVPVVGLIAYSLFKNGKRGWGWVCVGFLIVLVMGLLYVVVTTLRHMPRGSSSGWSAGGFGGGFGGGFSGGGGATGSW